MSVIPYTIVPLPEPGNPSAWTVQWPGMANGDVGLPLLALWHFADRSIQVEGTFGVAGNCMLVGSNDSQNFRPLKDPQGLVLNFQSADLRAILEATLSTRPIVNAGDGSTLLTVTLFVRGPQ